MFRPAPTPGGNGGLPAQARPIGKEVEALLDDYERHEFSAGLAEDFCGLRDDPAAWADYQAEVGAWEATLGDGRDDEGRAR